ncbi:MAG: hypothetical protein ACREU8_10445, partial [Gammaproteobacteria bacterium]
EEVCQEAMFFQGTDRGSDDDPVVMQKKRPQQRGSGGRNCRGLLSEVARGRNHIHPLQFFQRRDKHCLAVLRDSTSAL